MNRISIILIAVLLSGCSSIKKLDIFTMEVERQPLALEKPIIKELEKLNWIIITSENAEEVFKKLVATLRVFIPIVVRGEEDQGVRWWAVSPRTTYKEILNKVKDALSEGIDITDTSEGLDLIVRVEKGYNGWLIPESVDMSLRPSKLIDGNVDELLNTVTKIDELYTYRPISDMKEALSSFVNGSQEEDNSTGFTKTYSNDESKNDIDFDTKSSGKSVMEKFDQALGGE